MKTSKKFNAIAAALGLLIGGSNIVPAAAADSSITVEEYAKIASISVDTDTITAGETAQINIEWDSETAKQPKVYYDVFDIMIADVDGNGLITAKSAGSTVVRVHTNSQEFTLDITVVPAYSGTIGDDITWIFDNEEGLLTIEGTGRLSFEKTSPPWADLHKEVNKVVIGEGITGISENTFPLYSKLNSITLPSTLEEIEPWALILCVSLTDIEVSPDNENFTSVDGVLFNKDQTELIKYPASKSAEEYTIPDGTLKLGDTAFALCQNLTSVVISDSVTEIAENFIQCKKLENVAMSANLEKIDGRTFEKTPWLAAQCENSPLVVLNDHILLDGKTYVGELTIPENVDTIASYAFAANEELTSVTFNDKITSIPEMAFYGCIALESAEFSDSIVSVGVGSFASSGLKSVTLPFGLTEIGEEAFSNCSQLEDITILDPDCDIFDSKSTISNVAKTNVSSNITTIEFNGVIRAYNYTAAYYYTVKYGHAFESLGKAPDPVEIIYGDANCDKEVNIADAVYIMQALTNPDKYGYGIVESDMNMKRKGAINGDCYQPGTGLTSMDALTIQRLLLGFIGSLPVEQY